LCPRRPGRGGSRLKPAVQPAGPASRAQWPTTIASAFETAKPPENAGAKSIAWSATEAPPMHGAFGIGTGMKPEPMASSAIAGSGEAPDAMNALTLARSRSTRQLLGRVVVDDASAEAR